MNSKMVGATALCVAFIASGSFAQDFCNASHSGSKKTVSFSVGAGADKGETGPIGDYHYEQWNKSGSATTDFYEDGSFSCSFSNTDDFLCREGLFYGQNSGIGPLAQQQTKGSEENTLTGSRLARDGHKALAKGDVALANQRIVLNM